jgi:hypothetical protein
MKLIKTTYVLLVIAVMFTGCVYQGKSKSLANVSDEVTRDITQKFLSRKQDKQVGDLTITAPYNGAVFPPEIAAPTFKWIDSTMGARYWLIVVETNGRPLFSQLTNEPNWEFAQEKWDIIKKRSVKFPARVTVFGFENIDAPEMISSCNIQILTSEDRVESLILYRQVPLPFKVGEKNFRKIKWRLGDVSAYTEPPVIMQDLPVCASCHQVTDNGKRISMEMNYQNDSGAQFIAGVSEKIKLSGPDFMTWSDFPKSDILPKTRGLFGRVSPSGKYIVSTVNEISYAALTNELAFCQLMFPTYGILACYKVEEKIFQALKGANDVNFIQTNPSWSPDEKQIVFARSETRNEYHEDIAHIKTHIEDCGIEELNRRFPIQFDIWKVPFNNGEGGTPHPLKGASNNGKSNYYPRFSPDGKWIVYTRSKTGIMLQPDSELYIVSSEGGKARKMRCNRKLFNSWHSWSANSRWLLFSSKVNSMYTEIFITHIDENGNDSPPVCLSRFSGTNMASNLPEFVNPKTGRIETIRLKN